MSHKGAARPQGCADSPSRSPWLAVLARAAAATAPACASASSSARSTSRPAPALCSGVGPRQPARPKGLRRGAAAVAAGGPAGMPEQSQGAAGPSSTHTGRQPPTPAPPLAALQGGAHQGHRHGGWHRDEPHRHSGPLTTSTRLALPATRGSRLAAEAPQPSALDYLFFAEGWVSVTWRCQRACCASG